MIKHLGAFAIKLTLIGIINLTVLSTMNIPISWILLITLVIAVPSYIFGDLILLPQVGNFIATLADFLVYTFATTFALIYVADLGLTAILRGAVVALLLVFLEALYHEFVMKSIIKLKGSEPFFKVNELKTEFAEEFDVKKAIEKDKNKTKK